jgi:tRNA-Thr(GGU) m(6)t(6)A37 methyltransferase TsaA
VYDVKTSAENMGEEGGMMKLDYELHPIGAVESSLIDRDQAPRQGDEGAPEAWLVFEPAVREGIRDFEVGAEMILLTWLDRANRDELSTRPRGDLNKPLTGVFSTRSPDRPNPIGLHTVRIVEINDLRVRVQNLEALDGTPILDVKPPLGIIGER